MKALRNFTLLFSLIALAGCSQEDLAPGGSGFLEADEAIISAETSGQVVSLRFDEGTVVEKGDTLAVIDPSRLELELASARAGHQVALAQLEAAKLQHEKAVKAEQFASREHDRVATLYKSGTATQKQRDQLDHELTQATLSRQAAQASIAAIEAELTKIEADMTKIMRLLKDCYPLAPLGGIVTEKYVKQGELLSPGKPIVKISRLESLWVKVYLAAGDFASVKIGDPATVDTESGGRRYRGVVSWTSEEAEFTPKNVQTKKSRANLVYAVKVKVDNVDGMLKVGMPVFVTVGE